MTISSRIVCAMLSVLGSVGLVAFVDPASALPVAAAHAAPVVALAYQATPRG